MTDDQTKLLAASWKEICGWWSMRCGVIGVLILAGIPELNKQFPNIAPTLMHYFPHSGQQWVPVLGGVLALLTRVVSQKGVAAFIRQVCRMNTPAPTIVASWLGLCTPVTEHFESCYLEAYCDPYSPMGKALQKDGLWYRYLANRAVAKTPKYAALSGAPWSCGYGNTQGVTQTTVYTRAQAESLLVIRLNEAAAAVDRHVKIALLPHQKAALVDWTYNEGEGRLQSSTMLVRLNASDLDGAMTELLKWNIAGGVPNNGLKARRAAEKELFETGSWQAV